MKHLVALLAVICACDAAHAICFGAGKILKGDGCYVNTRCEDEFWFCGTQKKKCDGRSVTAYNHVHTYSNGQSFFLTSPKNDKPTSDKYFCCMETGSDTGRWVRGDDWIVMETDATGKKVKKVVRTEKRKLDGGAYCTETFYETVCGDEFKEPCNASDAACETGKMRNNECVSECPAGQAFASVYSNNCVICEETDFSGVVEYINDGGNIKVRPLGDLTERQSLGYVCLKCDPQTQIFNKKTQACEEKKEMTQYPRAVMKRCLECPGSELFKQCANLYIMEADKRVVQQNYTTVVKECNIKDDNRNGTTSASNGNTPSPNVGGGHTNQLLQK